MTTRPDPAPEWLDSLPPDDPAACAGRRDLRRLNGLMGNFRWLSSQVDSLVRPDDVVLEIGAGDGLLAQRMCGRQPALAARYHGLDLVPRPAAWPAAAVWHQTDLWSEQAAAGPCRGATVMVVNLVLHHFADQQLKQLPSLFPACRLVLACEPHRHEGHVWQGRLLFPVLHPVTRHDMVVSIRGGFRGTELATALGLDESRWECHSAATFFGAYRFVATLRP